MMSSEDTSGVSGQTGSSRSGNIESGEMGAEAGLAALSLLEALVLTLLDREVVTEDELDTMFEAAIEAHQQPSDRVTSSPQHRKVVAILKRLQVHGNSVRLP